MLNATERNEAAVDLRVKVGSLELDNPVMTASGTVQDVRYSAQHLTLGQLGAVVSKSLSDAPWAGHAKPNLSGFAEDGTLNAIGLANPGVRRWCETVLVELHAEGATVVGSVWGRSPDDFASVSEIVSKKADIAAIELNLSCPNLEDPRHLISHSAAATSDVVSAVRSAVGPERSLWAKLSPNTTDIVEIAEAASSAGADAVTLINTLSGMLIDVASRRPVLANGYGGVSGPLLLPVAIRAIHQVHQALPDLAVVGVGGVRNGLDAIQMLMAGASAVQVGTAHFAEPGASMRVLNEIQSWCARESTTPAELVGIVSSRFASDYEQ